MLKRSSVTGMVFCLAFTAAAWAELPSNEPISSTPGVAIQRGAANFNELARREAEGPALPKPYKVPGRPKPIPYNLPVPDEAVLRTTIIPDNISQGTQTPSAVASPPTAVSWQGLVDNNTRIPPDVHGAVGGPHVMTTLNSQIRVNNRSGGIVSTASLQTFWSPVGPFVGVGAFDPKVLYDPYNNRWMTTAVADGGLGTSSVLIAVSQGADPTGLWNLYRVDADAGDTVWADFPSIGFNKNWIAVQVNMYTNVGGNFRSSKIFCFDKADLYAGGAGLFAVITSFGIGGTQAPAATYDNSISTLYVLQSWNGNFMGNGFLRLYTLTGPVAAPVLTPVNFASVPSPWDFAPPGFADFAPQTGSAALIQVNDDRMHTVVYRNGSIWGAQTAFLPAGGAPNRSSVQWWQLTAAAGVSQFGRVDDGVPPLTFYAFPSLAVNKNNDMLLGYSSFSASQFAAGNYSYRASTDPANTLQSDVVLKAGEATYNKTFGGPANRWGDYSHTVVDPLDDKTLWTIQEYAESPANLWGTWWGRIGYVAGDINNDGAFTPSDVVLELNCVFADACPLPTAAYDMNCDTTLTPSDVVILLLLVFSATPPPC
ncbi:MAG: hypothetical protein L0209_07855 [candidate division Zixibacteria bacterium]|nr:hypothetical protein [candidate division Zixibacteria bacterium]